MFFQKAFHLASFSSFLKKIRKPSVLVLVEILAIVPSDTFSKSLMARHSNPLDRRIAIDSLFEKLTFSFKVKSSEKKIIISFLFVNLDMVDQKIS